MDSIASNYDAYATHSPTEDVCEYINGCTDDIALNYDSTATADDGSCEYIDGYADSTAINFDSTATANDGSCIAVALGCTDTLAVNYDSLANTDNGTCLSACNDITISLTSGSYDGEITWNVQDDSSNVLLSGLGGEEVYTLCLGSGGYVFNGIDSYGDGWNGATYSASYQCGDDVYTLIPESTVSGYGGSTSFDFIACSEIVIGCMDSIAVNFDALANISSDSCEYIQGCQDSIAENYNPLATADSTAGEVCEYVYGCLNELALNYDSAATMTNDSCEFTVPSLIYPESGFTLELASNDSVDFSWETLYTASGDVDDSYYVYLSFNPNDLGSSDFTSSADSYTGSVVYYVGFSDTTELRIPISALYSGLLIMVSQ